MTQHTLAEKVGPQLLDVTLAGQLLDLAHVGPVTTRHGRGDVTQPVEASSCSLSVDTAHLTRLPEVGDPLTVQLGADVIAWAGLDPAAAAAARPRFTGHVSDVAATPARRGTAARVRVTATSRRARLGRTLIGDAPWPVELDGARAARVLALAAPAVGATVGPLDPGTVRVTARDVDAQAALDLLDELAQQTGGQLVERRNGELRWHDADHRRNAEVDVELTAAQVLADVSSTQRLAGIVNELRVTYGAEVEGGQRPQLTYSDPASVTRYGPFATSLSTQLQERVDAEDFARLMVGRRRLPRWDLDELRVELTRTVDPATAGRLLQLEHADLIAVTGFPTTGPFSASRLWLEGWAETVTATSWALLLHVSDYARSRPQPRWLDVDPELAWSAADLTWLEALDAWGAPYGRGDRWADVPADTLWQTYPTAPTWAES